MTTGNTYSPQAGFHRFVVFGPTGPRFVEVPEPGTDKSGFNHAVVAVCPDNRVLVAGGSLDDISALAQLGWRQALNAGVPAQPQALAGVVEAPDTIPTALWGVKIDEGLANKLLSLHPGLVPATARDIFAAGDPAAGRAVARAVALTRNRITAPFDPATGEPVYWDATGCRGTTPSGGECFARINPCVIGLVKKPGAEEILLGRNAVRNNYLSALAGYCEQGETLEEAFIREVFEESGVQIADPTYLSSQPWPVSGSLMVAFTATALAGADPYPVDGELAEVMWVTRDQLRQGVIPLPRKGSVARRMIDAWTSGSLVINDRPHSGCG